MVKNLPANAGDMGSIPGVGRFHMPWSNQVHASQLLNLCARDQKPQLLKPESPHSATRSYRNENLCTTTREEPYFLQLEKSRCSNEDPA